MRAIETKYHGPTNYRGSRIIVTAGDVRKTFSRSTLEDEADKRLIKVGMYGVELHEIAAKLFCEQLNWKGKLVSGETKTGHVFVFVTKDQE